MERKRKNFVDFVIAAQKRKTLVKDFFKADSPKALKAFFVAKGYEGISQKDCELLMDAINKKPEPPEFDDPRVRY